MAMGQLPMPDLPGKPWRGETPARASTSLTSAPSPSKKPAQVATLMRGCRRIAVTAAFEEQEQEEGH